MSRAIDTWTNSHNWWLIFLHWFKFRIPTKFGDGIRCSLFFTWKLSLLNSFCQIQLKSTLPSTIGTRSFPFQYSNVDHIRKTISDFQWERSFVNMNVSKMDCFFDKTIKNVLSNYILHEAITCDDRNPTWINKTIKWLTQQDNITSEITKIDICFRNFSFCKQN